MPSDSPRHDPVLDDILDTERHHLDISRAALAAMRVRAESLETKGSAGDWVSELYLKSTIGIRIEQLADSPSTPLFFGRLDYQLTSDQGGESFHVGRRHVADDDGNALVVDWRAPVSVPFYRASPRDSQGVATRRRFGYANGGLTSYEDEHLDVAPAADADVHASALASSILTDEIERPRVGPMRDIVATIQPEQDIIVRTDIGDTVCVQGAPGTGKTAVGLHRAAYLLYTHRDQLARQRLLVIGPNDAFLRYIGAVLPALGEVEASQTTIDQLVANVRVRVSEPAEVATLKGDARMATVLRRALWARLRTPTEPLVVTRGSRRYRVPAYEVAENVAALQDRGVRFAAGRALLPQRLAHAVLLRMEADGDSPDDRVQSAVARSREVKAYVDQLWPAVKAEQVVFSLFADVGVMADAADGVLDEDEQVSLLWDSAPRSAGSARWSPADAALVDEVVDLLDRTPSLGHVVLDAAQDLSAMQLRAVGRRCSTGSATVLGDLAQGTTPWSSTSWSEALAHLGKPGAVVEELTLGFRVPGAVIDYAARLLPRIAPALTPPRSVRQSRGELEHRRVAKATQLAPAIAAAVAALAADREGSIGVVVPDALVSKVDAALTDAGVPHARTGDADDSTTRVDVVPATLAKGLEFDHVVLAEPAGIVEGEADETTGLRRLYVCLTRAVTSLVIVHARDIPAQLAGAGPES
jgi:DNA helicase IV